MLATQPWYFNDVISNLSGAGEAVEPGIAGVLFTPGNSNVDGAPVTLLPALSFDVCFIKIGIGGMGANGINDARALATILIDRAGGTSWSPLIEYLGCGNSFGISSTAVVQSWYNTWFQLPLWIPAGASLAIVARMANALQVFTPACGIWAYGNPSRPEMWWCGQKVETLGANPADSNGVSVESGNDAYGSWVNIGNPSVARYGAIQISQVGLVNAASQHYHWQLGYNNVSLPGFPPMYGNMTSSEVGFFSGSQYQCDVPQGTQFQMRSKGSTDNRANAFCLHGVY